MNKVMSAMAMAAMAGTVLAAPVSQPYAGYSSPVQQGMYEVRVGADYPFVNGDEDQNVFQSGGFGYFIDDRLLVGGQVSYEQKEWDSYYGVDSLWGLGAFTEYHFDWTEYAMPYVGASITLLNDGDDQRDLVVALGLSGGIKYYFNDYVSLYGQVTVNLATEGIYGFEREWLEVNENEDTGGKEVIEGDGDNFGVSAALGLRFLVF
jgi:hypothetical protein